MFIVFILVFSLLLLGKPESLLADSASPTSFVPKRPYDSVHFNEAELRRFNEDNARFQPAERDTARDMGEFMSDFFYDSQMQLSVDLDLFRELWTELDKLRQSAAEGDVDRIQAILDFFEPLKKYDVSAPCLSDLFHYLAMVYQYANAANVASLCTNCSCTAEFKHQIKDIQWIFDGR